MIHQLKIQRLQNINSVNPNEGRCSCTNCYATGFNSYDPMIVHCCVACSGHGNVNWIDNITENKRREDINKEMHRACSLNNMLESIILLRDSLASLDIDFVFKMNGESENGVKDIQEILDILEEHEMLQYHE